MKYEDAYYMIKSRRKIVNLLFNFRFIQMMVSKDSLENMNK